MTMRVVTIFGGTGFIGRHLVSALARRGIVVRIATRDTQRVLREKTAGVVGQIVPMRCNPNDAASVAGVIAGADAVINLIGILHQTRKSSFEKMHVEAAEIIARATYQAGITRFVHMSALGADINSESKYAQSKAEGERAVRGAHPDAVIMRPSVVFGPQDQFFNRFAAMAVWSPALPLIGGGNNKFQPVYVGDVVQAMMSALDNNITHGQTYELGGPATYSFRQILEFIMAKIGRQRFLLPLPYGVANSMAWVMELFPSPMLTRDQILLLQKDNIIQGRSLTLENLGITPTAVEAVVPAYLAAYQSGGRFAHIAEA